MSTFSSSVSHHIASLQVSLSPENWSKTAAEEAKVGAEVSAEEVARLKAVKARKEAEKLLREAEDTKDALEQRYRTRQEEKARYSAAQRSWWDAEALHATQGNSRQWMETEEAMASVNQHSKLIDKETRAIAARERRIKIGQEQFEAGLADERRLRDEEWAIYLRDTLIANQRDAEDDLHLRNRMTQVEMKAAARKKGQEANKAATDKFKEGEFERRSTELHRQQREVKELISHMKVEETKVCARARAPTPIGAEHVVVPCRPCCDRASMPGEPTRQQRTSRTFSKLR